MTLQYRRLELTSADFLKSVEGGVDLLAWFGRPHSFHDATISLLAFQASGVTMVIDAFRMTDRVDSAGYFENDLHCQVSLHLSAVRNVNLEGEWGSVAIIDCLEIRRIDDLCNVAWESIYGPSGLIVAEALSLELRPGDHRVPRPGNR